MRQEFSLYLKNEIPWHSRSVGTLCYSTSYLVRKDCGTKNNSSY